ncbi:MAG: hypothetical protein SXQ77_03270 [Halobacteria archaeon]|nr:hypothetical protein [Halobacteria archaeon]
MWIDCPRCGNDEFKVSREMEIQCTECEWSRSLKHGGGSRDHVPERGKPSRNPDRDDVFWFE